MPTFHALLLAMTDDGQTLEWTEVDESDLMDGDVTVEVTHSSLNFKDGLALTGSSPVVRRWPMIPGIDFVGRVRESEGAFAPGELVILTGHGVGETHLGGYAELARVPGDWLVALPSGLSETQAMAIGTAGLTSMLCVMALERHGVTPEAGPVLVTGAAGGVGSVAIALLAALGYEVLASSGRGETEGGYLRSLGASEVIDRSELSEPGRPMGKERWAAAIDSVGSHTLANVLAQTRYGGTVAACGLAQGMDLPASVAPFILRGVTLAGVDSVMATADLRGEAWGRLAADLPLDLLEGMVRGRVVLTVP